MLSNTDFSSAMRSLKCKFQIEISTNKVRTPNRHSLATLQHPGLPYSKFSHGFALKEAVSVWRSRLGVFFSTDKVWGNFGA